MGYTRHGILFSQENERNLIQVPTVSNGGSSLAPEPVLPTTGGGVEDGRSVVIRGTRLGHCFGQAAKPGRTTGRPELRGRLALEGS